MEVKPKPIFLIEYPMDYATKAGEEILADFKKSLLGYHVIFIRKDIEEINFKFN